jgi:hypothetical protein
MLKLLCVIGGILFSYAAIPQMIKTLKVGRHLGTPKDISAAIFGGTIVMYTYLTASHGWDVFLTINYAIEALSWGVLLFYGLFRAGQKQ